MAESPSRKHPTLGPCDSEAEWQARTFGQGAPLVWILDCPMSYWTGLRPAPVSREERSPSLIQKEILRILDFHLHLGSQAVQD